MTKKNIQAGLFILVASLLLSACGGAQPTAAPTVDANLIYTQAAQTVAANTEKTQAAQPPATATTQPSATPEPTKADPNVAAAQTATANAILNPNTSTNATPSGSKTPGANTTPVVVIPTATKAVVVNKPPSTTADKCQWVSNFPADNAQITKSASFDASIKVKNTGTTTWNNKYALRYFAGERMGAPDAYLVQNAVKPNENYTWTFTMTAPNSTGKKELFLVVQNPDGQNMCMINMPLEIVP